MKHIFLIMAAVFTGTVAFAQTTFVKGAVADSASLAPEPMAVVQFCKTADRSKPVAYTLTDARGAFEHAIAGKGDYLLVYENVGKKTRMVPFTLNGQDSLNLGRILVQDDVRTLKAGSVTAQRPLVRMDVDKITYDVENDVDSKSTTVLDMLRKVPMVTVDGQDQITVNGSTSFKVYVDGKPNQMLSSNPSQVFKMMPASAVKNIEVVTNPGVRYDAEGVGGVLNLTTNKAMTGGASAAEGAYGTVLAMASNQGAGGGLHLNAQKKKWTFGTNVNFFGMDRGIIHTEVVRDQTGAAGTTRMQNTSDTRMKLPLMGRGDLSASYEIDSLNLLSASAGLMRFGMRNDGPSRTDFSLLPATELFSYDGTSSLWMGTFNLTGSLDYQHTWKHAPKRSLVLSYQYSGSPARTETANTFGAPTGAAPLDLTDRRSEAGTRAVDHTFQADFTTPTGKGQTLSTGTKFLHRHNASDQTFFVQDGTGFVPDAARGLNYDYFNRIAAAYAEYAATQGKVSLKGGVRYEYTWQRVAYGAGQGRDFQTRYGNLVPSASVQYSFTQTTNLGLSYNLRISRPGITYLNPYVDRTDPTVLSYGNTALDVEEGHNISLVLNHFSPKWVVNLTGRYTFSGNGISQYSFYDDAGYLNTTYGNIVRSRNAGLNAFINWNASPKTRIYLNGSGSYLTFDSDRLGQRNDGWTANVTLGFQQTLPKDFRLSGNLIENTRNYSLQGWNSGMSLGVLGISKSFLEDRLSVNLTGFTPLTGLKLDMKTFTEGADFVSRTVSRIPIAQVMLSVSWTFGKNTGFQVKTARRTIQNDEVLNKENQTVGTGMMGGGM